MFEIKFETDQSEDLESESYQGEIRIGDFESNFSSSLEYWGPIDYELQWRRGIRTIVQGGEKSCLITSVTDPATANFLLWWVIYREEPTAQQRFSQEFSLPAPYGGEPFCGEPMPEETHHGEQMSEGSAETVLVFRNEVLVLEDIRSEFDLLQLDAFVPDRAEGEFWGASAGESQEWRVPLKSVIDWYESRS